MSKTHRLQVMLEHEEYQELVEVARRHRVTVSEWVRRALRELSLREPATGPDVKLGLVREAALGSYPTADIDQMLAEIDRGYFGRAG